jgi:hypothetical protein
MPVIMVTQSFWGFENFAEQDTRGDNSTLAKLSREFGRLQRLIEQRSNYFNTAQVKWP